MQSSLGAYAAILVQFCCSLRQATTPPPNLSSHLVELKLNANLYRNTSMDTVYLAVQYQKLNTRLVNSKLT